MLDLCPGKEWDAGLEDAGDAVSMGQGSWWCWRAAGMAQHLQKEHRSVSHSLELSSITLLPPLSVSSVPLRLAGRGAVWHGGARGDQLSRARSLAGGCDGDWLTRQLSPPQHLAGEP